MELGLVVDIGNTNTRFVFCDAENGRSMSSSMVAFPSSETNSKDLAKQLLRERSRLGLEGQRVCGVVIASVASQFDGEWKEACDACFGEPPSFLSCDMDTGLTFAMSDATGVGADRIANAVGGFSRDHALGGHVRHNGVLVVDVGTGTTWDVVSPDGVFLGGAIAAGPITSLEGLVAKSKKLSAIKLSPPNKSIGSNTVDALNSGVFYGYAGMIDRLCVKIREEVDFPLDCYATGGLSELICNYCEETFVVDKWMTMKGLMHILKRSQRTL